MNKHMSWLPVPLLVLLIGVGGISVLVVGLAFGTSGAGLAVASSAMTDTGATAGTLDRDLEPVTISGAAIGDSADLRVDQLSVHAYTSGTWLQIPAQVDEVTAEGTYVTKEDGLLDDNDEIVIMAKDLGDRAQDGLPTAVSEPLSGVRYEIEVTDPTSPTKKGWAYLIHSSMAAPTSSSDYVDFDATLHRINAKDYSLGLATTHRGFDYLALGGSGADILDRTKIRLDCRIPFICPASENDMRPKPDDLVKDGPVRVILQGGRGLAYGSMLKWRSTLNIPAGDVSLSTDFNADVHGATYYNAAVPDGVTIDGIPDTVAPQPLSPWWQISTDAGTVIQVATTASISGTRSNYYIDNSEVDVSDTGDRRRYGETGIHVVNPRQLIRYPFALYFLPGSQPNLGWTYTDYFLQPLSVEVTSLEGFTPEDVRLGDPMVSYVNLEFSPDMQYAAWVDIRLPPLLPSRAWLCAVDSETGDLIPSDGKGFLIAEIKNLGWVAGAPQWGEDSSGPFVMVIDRDDHLLMARPLSPTQATVTTLPTPPNLSRLYPFPARLPTFRHSYVAYLQHDDQGEYQSWYADLADPTVEHQVTFGPPGLYPPMDAIPLAVDSNRWFPGEPIFIFGYTNTVSSRLQIKQFDVSRPGSEPIVITDDDYDHIDEFPTIIFGERYLIGGIDNEPVGMLYKRPRGSEVYEPFQTIAPGATDLVTPTSALSFEAFTWEGRAYASFQTRDNSSSVLARTEPGEIWLTGLLEESLLRRISGPETMVRADPEFYIGTSQVWVFYVAKPVGTIGWELHRAATGLVAHTED